ncbi:lysophospholipase L1-like esterase [Arthrobacter pascens]|uniref:SGNH/GDSL hydrolase family protein n=1 Tax=Arthrobacter pascens TaxID=1677 RepID=UPI0028639F12|nr:SGNH/GDSL hydrolase family protein [Arthrobacter pascens]MDR6559210.1 lysophospholipase L1-like esterase [Arthrobacter pascens]
MITKQLIQRRTARLTGLLAVLALTAGLTAAPVSADGSDTYVALGDSFAAGQGASPYADACLRSDQGYPAILDTEPSVSLLASKACTGATTSVVRETQLASLDKKVDLVTVTAGGNDLDAIGALVTCTTDSAEACANALGQKAYILQQATNNPAASPFFQGLLAMLREIQAKAPHADIYVTGYPLLFESGVDQMFETVNGLTLQLNQVIDSAVTTAASDKVRGRSGASIHYVDVSEAFAGHGIGSAQPWIVGPPPVCLASDTCGTEAEIFHPTATGYSQGYAESIKEALAR